jgi:DNA-binding response OmpR family regulator
MSKGKVRVLVVDDEPRYVRAIQVNLEGSGYEVLTANDGPAAIAQAANEAIDLVLLDIRMPGLDGYEVCRRIRQFSSVPIIFLTARAETADKIQGLELGADDYVTKPFSAEELMARVQVVLRRAGHATGGDAAPAFVAGSLRIDFTQQRVFADEKEVLLTPTEYRLLWGIGYEGETQLVWQAIHRLRYKIEPDPQNPCYIQTRPGIGYLFLSPE